MPRDDPERRGRRGDGLWTVAPVVAGLLGLAVPVLLRWSLDLQHPTGLDAPLWYLNALNLRDGAPSFVAPGYPWLVAGLMGAVAPLEAGRVVSAACWVLVPILVVLLARRLGAGTGWSLAGALAASVIPQAAAFSNQIQPDSATCVIFLCLALAGSGLGLRRRDDLGFAASLAALFVFREQGVVVVPLGLLACALAPGGRWRRVVRVLVVAGLAVLFTRLVEGAWFAPWEAPWLHRAWMPVRDLFSTEPGYATELPPDVLEAHHALRRGGILVHNLREEFLSSGLAWAVLAAGLLAARTLRRNGAPRGILLGVLPMVLGTAPAILVHSQPRHVVVTLPVAFALLAAAAGFRRRYALALATAVVAFQFYWPKVASHERAVSVRHGDAALLGDLVVAAVGPGWVTDQIPHAWFPNPLPVQMSYGEPWRTVRVERAEEPLPPSWGALLSFGGHVVAVYRPEVWGGQRPCSDSRVTHASVWFHSGALPAAFPTWDPPCPGYTPVAAWPATRSTANEADPRAGVPAAVQPPPE